MFCCHLSHSISKISLIVFSLYSQVATDVIKEFAADGVKYLELRSTPREEKNTGKDVCVFFLQNIELKFFEAVILRIFIINLLGLTKKSYVETVLNAIQQCRNEELDIDVRYAVFFQCETRKRPT